MGDGEIAGERRGCGHERVGKNRWKNEEGREVEKETKRGGPTTTTSATTTTKTWEGGGGLDGIAT